MIQIILISLGAFIALVLLLMIILELISMYKTHRMKEILYTPESPSYWPTVGWRTSSPEEQGMNSEKLLEMIEFYRQKQSKNEDLIIDSITIIRNERIVADLYLNSFFPKDQKHIINSCTKSIMSALIGIAIDKGLIENVNVSVLELLGEVHRDDADPRLKSLTLKDLLTMRTGMHSQDSYLYKWVGLFKMQATDDWVEYILNVPFETAPNKRFDYSNMASFLLSAIITKTAEMNTLSFAQKYLFTPLGITDIRWDESPGGIHIGYARMWLKPHDMAKFGLLYLQKGKWEDQQLVPESWVEESIRAHSFPKQYRYIYKENGKLDFGASGGNWIVSSFIRPLTDGYGYQWWLDKSGIFSALGVGGQYISVVPEENLIIVFTSKLKGKDSFLPVTLLKKFILPSIESSKSLPANKPALEKLSSSDISPTAESKVQESFSLPDLAQKVSNKVYSLDQTTNLNPWKHNNLNLVFPPNENHAVISYSELNDNKIKFEIGLGKQGRMSNCNDQSYLATGEWINANTFVLNYEPIGYFSKGKWVIVFNGDEIEVSESGITGKYKYKGNVQNKI